MEKWEYKTISSESKGPSEGRLNIENFNMILNQLGNVGWEMVSCFPAQQEQGPVRELIAVLKRKISSGSADYSDRPAGSPGRAQSYPGKGSSYSEKSYGYKGKSSGFEGKAPGYKGKSSGFTGKGTGYKGKSSGNSGKGFGPKGRGPGSRES